LKPVQGCKTITECYPIDMFVYTKYGRGTIAAHHRLMSGAIWIQVRLTDMRIPTTVGCGAGDLRPIPV
jgi:hypothetical protein